MLDDNKSNKINLEIGIFLLCLSMFLYFLGILTFLDHSILVTANVSFLLGIYFVIGIKGTVQFFIKKGIN